MDASFLSNLPSRELFPKEMPRYPNLWLLLSEELVLRGQYPYAVRFWEKLLDEHLGLQDSFYSDIRNPNLLRLLGDPGEGSDFQARIGPLQYYTDPADSSKSHWHQLHARFYPMPLYRSGTTTIVLPETGKTRRYFMLPASVHYEVATEEESHPYVDSCPICGITGEYSVPIDRESEDYCQKIHDPLGLEFILHGTIRGEQVFQPDGEAVTALEHLESKYDLQIHEFLPGVYGCQRLGIVVLGPKNRSSTMAQRAW